MRVNPTLYYDSKVRQRKWGTTCDDCGKILKVGTTIKRAQGERNSYGCMTYFESCLSCWVKELPKSVTKEEAELEGIIKQKKESIKELKKMVKG
jgi:hypothetical protein